VLVVGKEDATFLPVFVSEHLAYSVLFLSIIFLPCRWARLFEHPVMLNRGLPTLRALPLNPLGIPLAVQLSWASAAS
jgi:hypothetical protein